MKKILSNILYRIYGCHSRRIRQLVLYLLPKLEGGELLSPTLRAVFKHYHDVEIGMYSYGWFTPLRIAPNTMIGRYCSIGPGVHFLPQNHPITFKSTHPYFYNPVYGCVENEYAPRKKLSVGNDVWIGQNALILPQVRRIGDGAIIGAGSVVTKNVPDFGIVAGNPARLIKYRFSPDGIDFLKKEKWWEKDLEELKKELDNFCRPFEETVAWKEKSAVLE